MECLLACARIGVSPRGAILYTTTFPCHNCARHLISAGIARVVFVEPYPKSQAFKLHNEEISLPLQEVEWIGSAKKTDPGDEKIPFEPFIGVGPRRYMEWFSIRTMTGKRIERKDENGKAVEETPFLLKEVKTPESYLSYLDRELIAFDQLSKLDDELKLSVSQPAVMKLMEDCADLKDKAAALAVTEEWKQAKPQRTGLMSHRRA